eukprot:scaffold11387_cov82-Isochrysis_galbana.AAC.2
MLAGALCCAALMPLRAPYHASSPLRPSSASGFRDCRSRVMLAAAGDGDQGARDAADGWTGGDRLFGLKSPADLVQNLLLQCAIQTQLSYYNEFKNEVRARWLESVSSYMPRGDAVCALCPSAVPSPHARPAPA